MNASANFKTKTSFLKRNNLSLNGVWPIALDIGYSSVKAFSPNSVTRFPSYAKKIPENFAFAGTPPWNAIIYKNNITNEFWLVGEVAQGIMSDNDTSDSEASLYGRERYSAPLFKTLEDVGLGLSLLNDSMLTAISKNSESAEKNCVSYQNERIIVQTGLPEKYMDDDCDLIESLEGNHSFSLKIGSNQWISFDIDIAHDDIFVMSQPKGTLFSICTKNNGEYVFDAKNYLSSSIVVFDAGFGTLDLFPIIKGTVKDGETYSDLGMKRVLQETAAEIKNRYKANIQVPTMQKHLETGTVTLFDKKTFSSKEQGFEDILLEKSRLICEEAIQRLSNVIDLSEYKYIIITGGTGAAWYNQILKKFENLTTLKILKGSENDDLPFVFANVRGYYLYRVIKLKKELDNAN